MQISKIGEENACPQCGQRVNGAIGPSGIDPKGQLTICIKCGGLAKFGDNFSLLKLTKEEEDSLPSYMKDEFDEIQKVIKFVAAL